MPQISLEKSKEKFEEYLKQIETIKTVSYEFREKQIEELNQKIRAAINLTFNDARDKLDNYKPNPFYAISRISSGSGCFLEYFLRPVFIHLTNSIRNFL